MRKCFEKRGGVLVICILESLDNRSRDGKKIHSSFPKARDERSRESFTEAWFERNALNRQ